jgi:hypothetical protein
VPSRINWFSRVFRVVLALGARRATHFGVAEAT